MASRSNPRMMNQRIPITQSTASASALRASEVPRGFDTVASCESCRGGLSCCRTVREEGGREANNKRREFTNLDGLCSNLCAMLVLVCANGLIGVVFFNILGTVQLADTESDQGEPGMRTLSRPRLIGKLPSG